MPFKITWKEPVGIRDKKFLIFVLSQPVAEKYEREILNDGGKDIVVEEVPWTEVKKT